MAVMLRFSLNQMVDRRRIALVGILALIPVGIVLLISGRVADGDTLDPSPILDGLVIAGVLPLVVMALATSAFGNELEDRTLNNLVLKPVSRVLIVLPKMAASILVAAPILL
ncbi:MAG: ABC transporter permease, partial [Chloroflexota bacterium]|nr:ABC transporter permease [Chloroflexota bacterium]